MFYENVWQFYVEKLDRLLVILVCMASILCGGSGGMSGLWGGGVKRARREVAWWRINSGHNVWSRCRGRGGMRVRRWRYFRVGADGTC